MRFYYFIIETKLENGLTTLDRKSSLQTSSTVTTIKHPCTWCSLQTSSTVTIIKVKNLGTWCTKTCVWKSAVLSLTVSFKNFHYFFYSIKHKFWLKRSLSASLLARHLKSLWSLLWLSCKNSTRLLFDLAEAAFAFFTAGAFPSLLFLVRFGFLLSSFLTSFLTPVPGLHFFCNLLEYFIQVKCQSHQL